MAEMLNNPAMMQEMMAALGGGGAGAGAGGFGGLGGFGGFGGAAAAPSDTRPPEERFQVQLQVSLNAKGFPIYAETDCSL